VPAKAASLSTVWINRRHNRPGWGATPEPQEPVQPDFMFSSMKEFAQAITGYSQLSVVPCLVNGFMPRVGRRW
jgi:hypothetical protein